VLARLTARLGCTVHIGQQHSIVSGERPRRPQARGRGRLTTPLRARFTIPPWRRTPALPLLQGYGASTCVTDAVTIPGRYNGPPGSANGGYVCGVVAGPVAAEAVEARLHSPPPLERTLRVIRDGARIELRDGATLVAEARPAELALDAPDPVPPDELARAEAAGYERWTTGHPFPTCFVCGPQRVAPDGMRVFPGELPGGGGLFGAIWRPDASLAGDEGSVRPECVWAALDCPTSAPVANFGEGPPIVLARLTARLGCTVRAGEQHSILSWALGREGRKRHAAAALYDSQGRMLCASRALWIELKGAPG
jgi:hypothetical protein